MAAARQYVQSSASGHSKNHYGDVHGNSTHNETHHHWQIAISASALVKNALFLTDPKIDRAALITAKGARVVGTCEWIHCNETFNAWQRGDIQVMWISGGPGKGKTMLAVYLTEYLEHVITEHKGLRVLYYFCDHQDKRRNTSLSVLRGIVWQFIAQEPHVASSCSEDFESTERTQSTLSSIESLWDILERAISFSECQRVVLVLDGLDECDEASVSSLSSRMLSLSTKTHNKLYAVIISRDIVRLRSLPRIKLDPDNNSHTNQDVERFISVRTQEFWHLDGFGEDIQQQLQQLLHAKADGTFLWVGFAMLELLKQETCSEVLRAARELPAGLPTLYRRMLSAVQAKHRATAARIFTWVALAIRPLSLREIAAIANVEPLYGLTIEQSVRDQIVACGPMLAIQEVKPRQTGFELEPGVPTVGFVHQSAKDYLCDLELPSDNSLAEFKIAQAPAHLALTRSCVQCLQDSGLHKPPGSLDIEAYYQSLRSLALLDYSTINWYKHAAAVDPNERQLWVSYDFFLPHSKIRGNWGWMTSPTPKMLYFMTAPPLELAAYLGILPWAKFILDYLRSEGRLHEDHGIDGTPGSDFHLPIVFAILGQQPSLVELLLSYGARVNLLDGVGCYPLHLACVNEWLDEQIVQQLLDQGAYVNALSRSGGTPLDVVVEQEEQGIRSAKLSHVADLLKSRGAVAIQAQLRQRKREAEERARWHEEWPGSGPDRRAGNESPLHRSGSESPRFWAGNRTPRRASSVTSMDVHPEELPAPRLERRNSMRY